VPGEQEVHLLAPKESLNVPLMHAVHWLVPMLLLKVPRPQGVQI
jgi:hypothetical protein